MPIHVISIFYEVSVNPSIASLVDELLVNFADSSKLPERDKIIEAVQLLMEVLFPGYTGKQQITKESAPFVLGDLLCKARQILIPQLKRALAYESKTKTESQNDFEKMATLAIDHLYAKLPHIREILSTDIEAAYDGDPAAKSTEEIILSYPFLTTITIHRLAHELYVKEVPLIPRIMSEYAHRLTGIDIHPGATIGKRFFIDHGTGVVIGETTIIGNNVKIYQGVTLGALSFKKDAHGRIIKGTKRHPTVEDDVVMYAEATILGDIVIGKGAVIGGNTWVKESIEPGVMVTMADPELKYKKK